ncbi:MAG: TolC family protein [Gemmataceae bacterium]|nr:TolC family protein [Gemmataceae bacterium]
MNISVSLLNAKHTKHMLVCTMLLFLPACGIPTLRQAEPGLELPADCNGASSADNSAQLSPAEFFNDPLLIGLIDQALAGNRELKILNEEVEIARNDILARRGAYFPFVTFGASAGVDKPSLFTPLGAAEEQLEYLPGKHFPDPLPNFQLGFNLLWPLDIWRELRNARDAAEQRFLAATERRNYFVTRLVAEIAENYYGLMALDKRLETLDKTIELQEQSLSLSIERKKAGRGTELAVQRFQAEVRKNQSEKLIVKQQMVEVENRINFLVNRFPQSVERMTAGFFDLIVHALSVGVPAQLLQNRADIRQAERELEAAGLDVKVARAHFFPRLDITAGVGYQAFSPQYLFWTPEALIYNAAGNLVAPLINKKAIKAEYMSANARQLESIYNYQRVVLNAFTEVVNRMSKVENYSKSIQIKKQQLESLEASVTSATDLFQNARAEYVEVLLAQRDLLEARTVLIETKREQLSAIVNAYQALGGGWQSVLQSGCRNAAVAGSLPEPSSPRPEELLPPPRLAPAPPDMDAQKAGS